MIYLIGHPTRDKIITRDAVVDAIGGTVWYAAQLMVRLMQPVAVVGCADTEIKQRLENQGVNVRYLSVEEPVVQFENDYRSGERRQRADSGVRLTLSAMPPDVFEATAVHIGPVLQEIDPAILIARRRGPLLLDAQGFLRYRTTENRVVERLGPDAETAIRHCDILKVDAREARIITAVEDIDTSLERLYRMGPKITIITQGSKGACLYDGARFIRLSAPQVSVVDPTGAGDVFAAAFLVRYLECGEPVAAGQFAVAAATLSTKGFGVSTLPSRQEIKALTSSHFGRPRSVDVRIQKKGRLSQGF